MKAFLLKLFAMILGVYLVKIKPNTFFHSKLAVAMQRPHMHNKTVQDVAVLSPHLFTNLQNTSIIKEIETQRVGRRAFRNEWTIYLDGILQASRKLKLHQNAKK